jgi:hypothetical protein
MEESTNNPHSNPFDTQFDTQIHQQMAQQLNRNNLNSGDQLPFAINLPQSEQQPFGLNGNYFNSGDNGPFVDNLQLREQLPLGIEDDDPTFGNLVNSHGDGQVHLNGERHPSFGKKNSENGFPGPESNSNMFVIQDDVKSSDISSPLSATTKATTVRITESNSESDSSFITSSTNHGSSVIKRHDSRKLLHALWYKDGNLQRQFTKWLSHFHEPRPEDPITDGHHGVIGATIAPKLIDTTHRDQLPSLSEKMQDFHAEVKKWIRVATTKANESCEKTLWAKRTGSWETGRWRQSLEQRKEEFGKKHCKNMATLTVADPHSLAVKAMLLSMESPSSIPVASLTVKSPGNANSNHEAWINSCEGLKQYSDKSYVLTDLGATLECDAATGNQGSAGFTSVVFLRRKSKGQTMPVSFDPAGICTAAKAESASIGAYTIKACFDDGCGINKGYDIAHFECPAPYEPELSTRLQMYSLVAAMTLARQVRLNGAPAEPWVQWSVAYSQ